MKAFHQALYAFWSQFGVPAYLFGHVPDGAEFPYITFDASVGDFSGSDVLTAFCWHKARSGANVNAERAALLDAIADAIPVGGTLIAFQGGAAKIYRNSAGFQSYYDDPEDKSVVGGRISYEVHYYNV